MKYRGLVMRKKDKLSLKIKCNSMILKKINEIKEEKEIIYRLRGQIRVYTYNKNGK